MTHPAPPWQKAASALLPVANAALAAAIFAADTITGRGFAVSFLYVMVVLLATRFCRARGVIFVAIGCAVLTLASYFLSHAGASEAEAVSNRLISLAAMALTTLLAVYGQSAEAKLRQQARLLDLTHDAIFVRGMDDVITDWNRGAEELYGWTREEALGRVTHQLLQTKLPGPLDAIKADLHRAGRWDGELLHTRRDGTRVTVSSRWSLLRDAQGRPAMILETNNDITDRKLTEERLSESEEQWRAVFEHNPTMFFIVDATGVVLSVNPLGAEQLGYTAEQLIGRPVQNLFHPDDRDAATTNTSRCLEQLGRAMSWELRKIRKDGRVICVRETARAVLIKNRPVVLIVCDDITARKQAEDARNLLMLEVDHRARNALAMVQAVACLTDASDPAHYRERVIGRIDAMARAQAALSRSHWGGGVLEEVIREELSCSATSPQFTLAGPAIMLGADQVQPISMIMHEMATNAIKHGALSAPGGTVAVSWTTNQRREVELTWKESGGPAVHQPERTGFGSRLIDRLAAQLLGSAEFAWPPTGLVATFRWRSA